MLLRAITAGKECTRRKIYHSIIKRTYQEKKFVKTVGNSAVISLQRIIPTKKVPAGFGIQTPTSEQGQNVAVAIVDQFHPSLNSFIDEMLKNKNQPQAVHEILRQNESSIQRNITDLITALKQSEWKQKQAHEALNVVVDSLIVTKSPITLQVLQLLSSESQLISLLGGKRLLLASEVISSYLSILKRYQLKDYTQSALRSLPLNEKQFLENLNYRKQYSKLYSDAKLTYTQLFSQNPINRSLLEKFRIKEPSIHTFKKVIHRMTPYQKEMINIPNIVFLTMFQFMKTWFHAYCRQFPGNVYSVPELEKQFLSFMDFTQFHKHPANQKFLPSSPSITPATAYDSSSISSTNSLSDSIELPPISPVYATYFVPLTFLLLRYARSTYTGDKGTEPINSSWYNINGSNAIIAHLFQISFKYALTNFEHLPNLEFLQMEYFQKYCRSFGYYPYYNASFTWPLMSSIFKTLFSNHLIHYNSENPLESSSSSSSSSLLLNRKSKFFLQSFQEQKWDELKDLRTSEEYKKEALFKKIFYKYQKSGFDMSKYLPENYTEEQYQNLLRLATNLRKQAENLGFLTENHNNNNLSEEEDFLYSTRKPLEINQIQLEEKKQLKVKQIEERSRQEKLMKEEAKKLKIDIDEIFKSAEPTAIDSYPIDLQTILQFKPISSLKFPSQPAHVLSKSMNSTESLSGSVPSASSLPIMKTIKSWIFRSRFNRDKQSSPMIVYNRNPRISDPSVPKNSQWIPLPGQRYNFIAKFRKSRYLKSIPFRSLELTGNHYFGHLFNMFRCNTESCFKFRELLFDTLLSKDFTFTIYDQNKRAIPKFIGNPYQKTSVPNIPDPSKILENYSNQFLYPNDSSWSSSSSSVLQDPTNNHHNNNNQNIKPIFTLTDDNRYHFITEMIFYCWKGNYQLLSSSIFDKIIYEFAKNGEFSLIQSDLFPLIRREEMLSKKLKRFHLKMIRNWNRILRKMTKQRQTHLRIQKITRITNAIRLRQLEITTMNKKRSFGITESTISHYLKGIHEFLKNMKYPSIHDPSFTIEDSRQLLDTKILPILSQQLEYLIIKYHQFIKKSVSVVPNLEIMNNFLSLDDERFYQYHDGILLDYCFRIISRWNYSFAHLDIHDIHPLKREVTITQRGRMNRSGNNNDNNNNNSEQMMMELPPLSQEEIDWMQVPKPKRKVVEKQLTSLLGDPLITGIHAAMEKCIVYSLRYNVLGKRMENVLATGEVDSIKIARLAQIFNQHQRYVKIIRLFQFQPKDSKVPIQPISSFASQTIDELVHRPLYYIIQLIQQLGDRKLFIPCVRTFIHYRHEFITFQKQAIQYQNIPMFNERTRIYPILLSQLLSNLEHLPVKKTNEQPLGRTDALIMINFLFNTFYELLPPRTHWDFPNIQSFREMVELLTSFLSNCSDPQLTKLLCYRLSQDSEHLEAMVQHALTNALEQKKLREQSASQQQVTTPPIANPNPTTIPNPSTTPAPDK